MGHNSIDRNSSQPLYKQVKKLIARMIASGEVDEDRRIPTELELVDEFRVSRITVRKAISELVEEGVLERISGKGTFVVNQQAAKASEEPSAFAVRSMAIGVVVPFVTHIFASDIIEGIETVLKDKGYNIVLRTSRDSFATECEDINQFLDIGVQGIIVFPTLRQNAGAVLRTLNERKYPFVLVDRYFDDLECNAVISDNFGGGYIVTKHLISLGYKTIGFVSPSPPYLSTIRARCEGYRTAVTNYGLGFDDRLLLTDGFPVDDNGTVRRDETYYAVLEDYLEKVRPRAVFVCDDLAAIDVLNVAARLGLSVPEDLAVVGFDAIPNGEYLDVPLTSVRQITSDIGRTAANLLLSQIMQTDLEPCKCILPTELVIRNSCGSLSVKGHKPVD